MSKALAAVAFLALTACNGAALVTLTSTPATVTGFLNYRVELMSLELQESSGGGATVKILPAGLSVDLTQLTNIGEILGASPVKKGKYTSVTVTVDYTHALIVADDGSQNGVTLNPVDANGRPVGQVSLTLQFDANNPLRVTTGSTSQLALDFRLSASNDVDLSSKTVTVTPLLVASAIPIDSKQLRLRGPLESVSGNNTSYLAGIEPFDGLVSGTGRITVVPTSTTTFEINGVPSTGAAGLTGLAALSAGTWTVAYGALTATTNTSAANTSTNTSTMGSSTAVTTTTTSVSFVPAQVWAAGSVQGGGQDRVSGVVTARSGNTLTVPSATWLSSAGAEVFVSGVATITIGAATAVTVPGQAGIASNSPQQISVGSVIDAFGTVTSGPAGNITMDATAGRVRLENTTASGLVTLQGAGSLTVDLLFLGGRAVAPFDFAGTGSAGNPPSSAAAYQAATGDLSLANALAGTPVELSGLVASFGAAQPDFSASALLDATTMNAELVIDWGSAGTPTPFTATSASEIDLQRQNTGIGLRHQIAVGAQIIEVKTLPSDLLIVPSSSATLIYAIAHASTSTVENFNTFADFIAALQTELNGTTVATAMTAEGVYTQASTTLTATSVTVFLNI